MKLKTHICKKTPSNTNGEYDLRTNSANSKSSVENQINKSDKSADNLPLSCVDWSSNDEIYFVRCGQYKCLYKGLLNK